MRSKWKRAIGLHRNKWSAWVEICKKDKRKGIAPEYQPVSPEDNSHINKESYRTPNPGFIMACIVMLPALL
jgi:hypothetical protein